MTHASANFSKTRQMLLATLLAVALGTGQVHAGPLLDEVFGSSDAPPPAMSSSATDAALAAVDTRTTAPLSLMPPKDGGAPKTLPPVPSAASSFVDSLANFGPSSGTEIGQRALELRDEVLRLRAATTNDANEFMTLRSNGAAGAVQYHSTVAAITARLQNGTTRGNPILQRQWHEAEFSLNQVNDSLAQLNALATSVANDASLAGYLLESVQAAFQLSGAVDEDHDQLSLLRDEVSRLIVQTDYLRTEVTGDIQRQTSYLTSERNNLQSLSFAISSGEMFGANLVNRPVMMNNNSQVMAMPSAAPATMRQAPTPLASPSIPVTPAPLNNFQHNSMV
ncbi:MAG: hypothetical protein ABL897_12255, partial [Hyphomicrobium sp.]